MAAWCCARTYVVSLQLYCLCTACVLLVAFAGRMHPCGTCRWQRPRALPRQARLCTSHPLRPCRHRACARRRRLQAMAAVQVAPGRGPAAPQDAAGAGGAPSEHDPERADLATAAPVQFRPRAQRGGAGGAPAAAGEESAGSSATAAEGGAAAPRTQQRQQVGRGPRAVVMSIEEGDEQEEEESAGGAGGAAGMGAAPGAPGLQQQRQQRRANFRPRPRDTEAEADAMEEGGP